MTTFWLFIVLVAAWGPSWYAITFQIAEVSPEVSVGIRFVLAGMLFALYCRLRGISLRIDKGQMLRVTGIALLLFSVNYLLFYNATTYMSSGLVCVIFSTLPIINMVNAKLILGESSSAKTWLAAAIGLFGIALVFHHEWQVLANLDGELFIGIGLCVAGTYVASLGNILAMVNQRRGIDARPATAIGMLIGGSATLLVAYLSGSTITVPMTVPFLSSLLFLSTVSSCVAFFVYFRLLELIGPGRTAYSALVFPIVAITISVMFEGYQMDALALTGFALILIGNALILMQKDKPQPRKGAAADLELNRGPTQAEAGHQPSRPAPRLAETTEPLA